MKSNLISRNSPQLPDTTSMQKQISSRIRRSRRNTAPHALSVTSILCAAGSLSAQTAAPSKLKPQIGDTTEMEEVLIEAAGSVYNPTRLQSAKYTEPLLDIPQTITVIPKAVIEDRGAFSLRDVLKNTPGISMQAGEGGGGLSGDNLSIRGFSARSDIYLDGIRDYAAYNRDPFNTEQVEITKGPSSSTVGRGSTGGSINTVSKMANLTDSVLTTVSAGTSNLYRGTVDVNQKLTEHSAFRLNGMYHTADTPGRDHVESERYGIAASLGFGLGTDTRFTLNYQRLEESNIPDYGIPWVPNNGTFSGSGASLTTMQNQAAPVSFNTFYGLIGVDYEKIQTDHFTAIFEHDFTKNVRLRNATRYTRSHRDSVTTAPRFRDINAAAGNQYTTVLNRQLQRRQLFTEMFGNQTNLVAEFTTGPIKHAFITGMEFYLEHQQNANAAGVASVTDLFNPGINNPPASAPPVVAADITTMYPGLPAPTEAYLYTVSAYVFDTMKIGKHWEISGGLRYDHMYATVSLPGNAPGFANADDLFSYKAALIYKPVKQGSIYFGYGTSFNPTIDGVSTTGLALTAATSTLDPEQTSTYELGTKWDLLEERLSLTAALFHSQKINARTTDPLGVVTLGGDQVVQGIEFSMTGNITKNWQVFAGYAIMESKTKASTTAGATGQVLSNAPPQTFNLWTTYTLLEKTQLGFGAQYMGSRTSNDAATGARTAPGYWTMDAMLSYKFTEKVSLRLNVYNLANERFVGSVGGGHFVPGAGRSAALTASVKF